jgi:hypothetical protein
MDSGEVQDGEPNFQLQLRCNADPQECPIFVDKLEAMPSDLERALRAAGLSFRRVEADGDTGFLLHELPEAANVAGLKQASGLFLIAEGKVEALLAAASPGAQLAESGTLRIADLEIPIYRYVKPGEPSGNLARRAGWFQKRVR